MRNFGQKMRKNENFRTKNEQKFSFGQKMRKNEIFRTKNEKKMRIFGQKVTKNEKNKTKRQMGKLTDTSIQQYIYT